MSQLDDQMAEVAEFFAGRLVGDTDVLGAEHLDRERLDYSVESITVVDDWLEHLFAAQVDPNDPRSGETIVWAGAYVGEVIRRNASVVYAWARHEDYIATADPDIAEVLPYSFGTQFLLVANEIATLPINKVGRWLREGPENNLYFYVSREIAGD